MYKKIIAQKLNKKKHFKKHFPSLEEIKQEMDKINSVDDLFGKNGLVSNLCGKMIEKMMEAELDNQLGYSKNDPVGNNSGNSRNGYYQRNLKTTNGKINLNIPRDRNGEFKTKMLDKNQGSTNELEEKILYLYSCGNSIADISDFLRETYGSDLSESLISQITDKVLPLMEEWQSRPLERIYVITYLDCVFVKLRRNGTVENVPIYSVLGIDLDGKKDILGHYIGEEGEGSKFWLNVVSDLKNRGIEDILIACVDGLKGFSEAINAVYPKTVVQRCVIHQIRYSLKYISWKDRKEFLADLKGIYQAKTKQSAEQQLKEASVKWQKYDLALTGWRNNWEELSRYYEYTPEIRRLIYTTNMIEGYFRQIRKVTKTKGAFPTDNSVLKIFYLSTKRLVEKKFSRVYHWPIIINQLSIKFKDRFDLKEIPN